MDRFIESYRPESSALALAVWAWLTLARTLQITTMQSERIVPFCSSGCRHHTVLFYPPLSPPRAIPRSRLDVTVDLLPSPSSERKVFREKVVDVLTEKLRHVVQAMNRQQYLPHTPPQAELDLVFDTSFPDVQPYLFKVGAETGSGVQWPVWCWSWAWTEYSGMPVNKASVLRYLG